MPIVLVPLAIVLVAILGILLIHASQQFTQAVAGLLPDWHIPGLGSIRGWATAAGGAFVNNVLGIFGQALAPLASLVSVPTRWLQRHLTGWLRAAGAALTLFTYLRTALIPYLFGKAISEARSLYLAALHYAETRVRAVFSALLFYYHQAVALIENRVAAVYSALLFYYHQAVALIENRVAAVYSAVLFYYHQAVALIENRVAAVYSALLFYYHQAVNYADSLAHQAATELAYTRAWLIAYCDAKVAAVVGAAVQGEHVLLGRALAGIWPRVIASVDGAIDVAGEDFRDVVADLKAIPRAIENNPAVAAAGAATAIDALVKLARDCVMPNCRNLSNVGRDIQELFGVVEGAGLIGLLAEAARDPEAVAREALTVARPVIDGAVSIVRDQVAA